MCRRPTTRRRRVPTGEIGQFFDDDDDDPIFAPFCCFRLKTRFADEADRAAVLLRVALLCRLTVRLFGDNNNTRKCCCRILDCHGEYCTKLRLVVWLLVRPIRIILKDQFVYDYRPHPQLDLILSPTKFETS